MNKLNTNKFLIVVDLNSLFQTINNLEKTKLFKSLLMLSFFLAFSIVSSGTDYDGYCPPGATSYTDCDCNPGGMDNFVAIDIKDTSDYGSVIHIDPDANDQNEDGSAAHPYNSWFDVSWSSNTAYVQKRGTTFSTTTMITSEAGNVMLGAYGSGDKPVIINTSTSSITLNVENDYVLVRDLCLQAPNLIRDGGTVVRLRGNANYAIVYMCDICNSGNEGLMGYSDYGHIIWCNFYDIEQDAIWIQQTPYFEIAYNNIYDFNQSWYPGAPMSVSAGDGIQVENDYEEVWIHHNMIDHGDTGNKANIILSSNELDGNNNPYQYTCERAIIEFNTFIGLKVTQYNGCILNLDQGDNQTIRYNKMYAAEIIEDSYPDSLTLAISITSDHDSIYGNVFVDFNVAIQLSTATQTIITNNTFYNTQNYILKGSGAHAKFYNNIFDQNLFTGVTVDAEADNMFVSGTPWANSFSGDPDYVNAGNNDFRLQSTSDAIDEGTSLSYYMYDIEMNEISGTIDVGANEYSSSQDTIPDSPSSLTVNNTTQTSIGIGWSDNSTNEDKFIIERSLSSGSGFAVIDSVNANVTSYTSTGLSSNTTYYFKVKARNSYGDSGYSNTANGTTQDTSSVTNVALGKTATQSSTDYDGYASLAVDGDTNGSWTNGSVTHTDNDANAWWQVDLGQIYSISSIEVWNRTDICCMDRLDDYYVFLADTFLSYNLTSTINQSGVWYEHRTSYPDSTHYFSPSASGRYVRVQLGDTNNLSLAEVVVWGSDTTGVAPSAPSNLSATDSTSSTITIGWTDNANNEDKFIIERSFLSGSGFAVIDSVSANVTSYTNTGLITDTTYYYKVKAKNSYGESAYSNTLEAHTANVTSTNISQGKTTTQSSTVYDGYSSLAVDGDTNGSWTNGSVTHTDNDANAWWQVDLGDDYQVTSIEVWNRTDVCCMDRLDNYYVMLADTFTSTSLSTALTESTWSEHKTTYPDSTHYFYPDTTGHYVRVQLGDTNNLSLAEVVVWGYDADLKKAILSEEINSGIEPEKPINVYPNPGSTMITISGFEQAVEIKMVDMLGKVVYLEEKVNNSTQIDVSSLKKGLYLILVKKENNIHVTKFIKN